MRVLLVKPDMPILFQAHILQCQLPIGKGMKEPTSGGERGIQEGETLMGDNKLKAMMQFRAVIGVKPHLQGTNILPLAQV